MSPWPAAAEGFHMLQQLLKMKKSLFKFSTDPAFYRRR